MNKANLKSYAPRARLDFIAAVTARANLLGISATGALPAVVRGDVVIIDGREWPAKLSGQRDALIARINRRGFEQTMDEVAYTWFNRFAALRFMEIHEYLDHGWRVMSSRDGGLPEILRHASEVLLPGLNADRAREMQLAGNQDNELYKLLLVAQCNELSRSMPFLFERIDDETELLLPENLLRTDSIVSKLVAGVPEEDWQQIESIGWLYQFYISEKKDEVIGKVVKSEDIPAATQLFTPNWIVQYLVQNSVGRLWLMANPTSPLISQWPYYIDPAAQTLDVQAQLDALIQTRVCADGDSLNPETITVLDPACGSGHILVVAYDVLKAIYLERGYQPRAIPRLILEKNLYGLDIDDRAAQLAAFAVLMKGRADDRRIFNDPPKLNVLSLQESKGLDADELTRHLVPCGLQRAPLKMLLDSFEDAKTIGSLIQIPTVLRSQLKALTEGLDHALCNGDLYARQAARDVLPLVAQAVVLTTQFDAVLANPPYMGGQSMNECLKKFARQEFAAYRADLFALFMAAALKQCKPTGFVSMVTMQAWMFLSAYEDMRTKLINERSLLSLVQIGYNSFPELNSKVAQACAFVLLGQKTENYIGTYLDLNSAAQSEDKSTVFHSENSANAHLVAQEQFRTIPGSPIAYSASAGILRAFSNFKPLHSLATPRVGMITGDNNKFLRRWPEVSFETIGIDFHSTSEAKDSLKKWFPYQKGGDSRKWYGNNEYVVDWENDGHRLKTTKNQHGKVPAHAFNDEWAFRPNVNWSKITSGEFSCRITLGGHHFDDAGSGAFSDDVSTLYYLGAFLNTMICRQMLRLINPTLNFQAWNVGSLPVAESVDKETIVSLAIESRDIAKEDWDSRETSFEFQRSPFLAIKGGQPHMSCAWNEMHKDSSRQVIRMKVLEEKIASAFIDIYGLQEELSSDVSESQITLFRTDRERDCQRFISYAIGCMMGRYSLDAPGLIYANAGNVGFDARRYEKNFPADSDGIVPITDERWFEDDAAGRLREFLRAVWGAETLEENMAWLAESLGIKGSETPDETIRRYLADKFFKDHLQTYKKRPIYWLFSSGKQGAFQALVYLHRYHEGTLGRLRAEYVVPLMAKFTARLEMLDKDAAAATSTATRIKIQKQIESIRKKQVELLTYDEKLRHYADMRIRIDLDDGVNVNYAKFADLVAESKGITGGSDD